MAGEPHIEIELMKHLRHINESLGSDGQYALEKFESSVSGKDIIAIIGDNYYVHPDNEDVFIIGSNQTDYYIRKSSKDIGWEVTTKIIILSGFQDLEKLYGAIWKRIMSECGFAEYPSPEKWIESSDCSAIGKQLNAQEILKEYNKKTGLYTLEKSDLMEFSNDYWKLLEESLGVYFYTTKGKPLDSWNPQDQVLNSIQIEMLPLEGGLRDIFLYLMGYENSHIDSDDLDDIRVIIKIGIFEEKLERRNYTSTINVQTKEEFLNRVKSEFVYWIKRMIPRNNRTFSIISALVEGDVFIVKGIIENILSEIKNEHFMMNLLSNLRKKCPTIYNLLDKDERKDLAADLGDVGF